MIVCHDRDVEAARNIEWARKGISSVALGSSIWNDSKRKNTDAAEAFRSFSKKEMDEVRGSMALEVQKDLRAVHWQHGFQGNKWESEAMRSSKSTGDVIVPERQSKNLQITQFKLGRAKPDYSSGQKEYRVFSRAEQDDVRGAMADAVRKDLRAVHVFAPYDKNDWKSDAMKVGSLAKNIKVPYRHSKDLRSSNVYLGGEHLSYTSDAKEHLREFNAEEMESVRGSMAKEVQADLRAVHFKLGTDKGILDRHISERLQSGPVRSRPQSAPSIGRGQRPRSAVR